MIDDFYFRVYYLLYKKFKYKWYEKCYDNKMIIYDNYKCKYKNYE